MVLFSTHAEVRFNLNKYNDKATLKRAIYALPYLGGYTNTAEGIRLMNEVCFTFQNGDRPDAQNLAIVVTDGRSTMGADYTIPFAVDARAKGIRIVTVGVTDSIDLNEIEGMSSAPHKEGEDYFLAVDFAYLNTMTMLITETTCGQSDGSWFNSFNGYPANTVI